MNFKSIAAQALAYTGERSVRQLRSRITFKYNGANQHRDEWLNMGTAVCLSGCTRNSDDGGEYGSYLSFVLVDSCYDEADIKIALKHMFTTEGCSCEHDCCGCISRRVSHVKKFSNIVWVIKINWTRNI